MNYHAKSKIRICLFYFSAIESYSTVHTADAVYTFGGYPKEASKLVAEFKNDQWSRGLSFCSEQWDCSHSLWVFFSPIKSSSARSEKLWEQWFLNCSQEKSSQSNGFRSDPTKKFSEHFFTERSDEFSLNFTVWRPILEWIDPGSILTSKIS